MMTATMFCQQICLLLSPFFWQEAIAAAALKDSINSNHKSSLLSQILSADFETNSALKIGINIPSSGPTKRDEPYSADYGPGMPYNADYGPGMPDSADYGPGMPYSGDYGSGVTYSGDYGSGMPYSGDYGSGMPYSGMPYSGDYGSGMPYSGDYGSGTNMFLPFGKR
ncbi:prepilin-type n-terminal cleavage/methylation domain-containing protein [Plakobranchus ocellatus]|uniref:Prepilin-type n-terminal cleavage/methylation domain-containing protein n=1 Tax=Plakobranchus ocellatus TaxID=259542 RepID=A0AAV4BDP8_9GAST|nr:prepilin-type n-terminal cleavage/methylation domain-containing protein [Plakobranchus ocellatus]